MNTYPKKLMLLGSGELGKEVAIAAKRIGCYLIACDRYPNAPAMQVSDESEVFNMNNAIELTKIIEKHSPDIIIPEIEALAVEALKGIEEKGMKVIPNARATEITMNRDLIRNLASSKLKINTAKFAYAENIDELKNAANGIGWPLIIKPVMSSSGKGQSLVKEPEELEKAWASAISGSRGKSNKVIIEEFIIFELEITLLTIRQKNGETLFCDPIGHEQVQGDYQCSWQPAIINKDRLKECQEIAKTITDELGGEGIFGVEFFISKDKVIFSELSPRPHDTGLVTIISQNLNEFELHLRAILNIPIPKIKQEGPSASRVILCNKEIKNIKYTGLEKALKEDQTKVLIFGKKDGRKRRRMGVALAQGKDIQEARKKADAAAKCVQILDC